MNSIDLTNSDRLEKYPFLGVGVGLRVPHYEYIFENTPKVDWFEIISENFMLDGGRALYVLDKILEDYKVVQHGVAMYLGNADGLNFDYLKKLKTLIKKTKTPWLSDHLCWGSVDGKYSHDLLPLPYTKEAIKTVVSNLKIAQDYLEIPIIVENLSSYTEFKESEMEEWEFLSEIVEQADAGILLDVNNIYVSALNHRFDSQTYLDAIDPKRVAQIHVAGHSHYKSFAIDTHDHPVIDSVWKIYEAAINKIGSVTTLLEWDEKIPSFEETVLEAEKSRPYLDSILNKVVGI